VEKLNSLESIILGGLALCWLINLLLPAVLWLSGIWLSFCKRLPLDNYKWAYKYQELKYKRIISTFTKGNALGFYILFDLAISLMVMVGVTSLTAHGYLLPLVVTVVVIAGLLFIPRFIFDVCKTLKYKPKTGESETIEKLKEDVRTLQERLDNKQ